MQITTKLHRLWTWLVLRVHAALDNRLWKERMSRALADVPKEQRPLFETVLTNQMRHQRQETLLGARTNTRTRAAQALFDDTLFAIVKRVLQHITELQAIVGVQPMQGPVGQVFQLRYKYVDDGSNRTDGSKVMRLEVSQGVVEAVSRKLAARWSMEMAQDLQTTHGVGLAGELIEMLALQISHEIAQEVFSDLIELARQGAKVDHQHGSFADDRSPEDTFTRNATLGIKVNTLANRVGMDSRRGPANFIIGNAVSTSLLQTLGSAFVPVPKGTKAGTLLTQLGTLNGSIKVYYSTLITDDVLIIGFKGSTDVDSGYIYAPYVPLMVTGPMIDPATFQPIIGTITRYGKYIAQKTDTNVTSSELYYAVLTLGAKPLVDQVEQVK